MRRCFTRAERGWLLRFSDPPGRWSYCTAVILVLSVATPGCVPPWVASRYEVYGVPSDSLCSLVPAVADNFGWKWSRRTAVPAFGHAVLDSVEAIENSSFLSGFRRQIYFDEGSFVIFGHSATTAEGKQINNAIASCLVQEHRLRLGLQDPSRRDWRPQSHLTYAGAELVSPILGQAYLNEKSTPFHYEPGSIRYAILLSIEVTGIALLFNDTTRDAGLYTLAGIRLLRLPLGLYAVTEHNAWKIPPYSVDQMWEEGFSPLGLRPVKHETFDWP